MSLLIENDKGEVKDLSVQAFFNALNAKARRNQMHVVRLQKSYNCTTARRGVPDFNGAIIRAKNAYEAIKAYHGLVDSYCEIDGVGTCIDAFGNAYFARPMEDKHA